jgi:hypothetical protein
MRRSKTSSINLKKNGSMQNKMLFTDWGGGMLAFWPQIEKNLCLGTQAARPKIPLKGGLM